MKLGPTVRASGGPGPEVWLLYGENIYDQDPRPLLSRWPGYGLDRPVFVSEFGAQGNTPVERAQGYVAMWRGIRGPSGFS